MKSKNNINKLLKTNKQRWKQKIIKNENNKCTLKKYCQLWKAPKQQDVKKGGIQVLIYIKESWHNNSKEGKSCNNMKATSKSAKASTTIMWRNKYLKNTMHEQCKSKKK
jgi:hypothetical protein